MNHLVKTRIFKLLSLFPDSVGDYLYHLFQEIKNPLNIDQVISRNHNWYKKMVSLIDKLQWSAKDKKVLEIGSGWHPLLPYFFKFLGGVNKVFTYDLNQHYAPKKIQKINTRFSELFRINSISNLNSHNNLPESIQYFPKTNILNVDLPKVDLIFSKFVLEHVTPEDISSMHKKFRSILNKDGIIVHMISPSDHRAYSDSSLSLFDFLQYSSTEWNKIQTRFDYHNRLRLPQYLKIFREVGLEVLHLDYSNCDKDSTQYQKFQKLTIHEDFKQYSIEALTASSINIVLGLK